jgi:nucleoside-diphosphate-sugar epimerase
MTVWAMETESQLDDGLTRPTPRLVEALARLDGDLIVLGVAGKMGVHLAQQALRASREAGSRRRIFGVARFSDPAARRALDASGVETLACDLLDPDAVRTLPRVPLVVFMAGQKFGTEDCPDLTWAVNTLTSANVCRHFSDSRIVAFSTGCVYPLVSPARGPLSEAVRVDPVGEYAQACVGRERIFEHFSRTRGTPVCLLRLCYAMDLRYGVLHDIARRVWQGEPVPLSVTHFNLIWQGDANAMALQALHQCTSPATVLNLTGPWILQTREVALAFGQRMGKEVRFDGPEGPVAYLADARKALDLFGGTTVPPEQMIEWTARWVASAGRSLNKPSHFEVSNGRF